MSSWRGSTSSRWGRDRLLLWSLRGAALISTILVLLIALFVAYESLPLLRTVSPVRLLTDRSWNPLEGAYNLAPMIVGTLLVSVHIYDLAMNVSGGDGMAYASALVLMVLLIVLNRSALWLSRRWAARKVLAG